MATKERHMYPEFLRSRENILPPSLLTISLFFPLTIIYLPTPLATNVSLLSNPQYQHYLLHQVNILPAFMGMTTEEWHLYPEFLRSRENILPPSLLTISLFFPLTIIYLPTPLATNVSLLSNPQYQHYLLHQVNILPAFMGMTTEEWHLYPEFLRSTVIAFSCNTLIERLENERMKNNIKKT